MPKVPLNGMTFNMLADGYAGKAIEAAMQRITEDVVDRGQDGQKRVMTIKVTFVPEDGGRCAVHVDVGVKCPGYRPPSTVAKYDDRAGGFVFNPDASDNPDQSTIVDHLPKDE